MNYTGNNDKKGIVIIGRNYGNILTMTRALGFSGYDVNIVRLYKNKPKLWNVLSKMKPEAYSKYVKSYSECIVNRQYDKVIDLLKKFNGESNHYLLIPVDDYTAAIIDNNLESLKDKFFLPSISGKEGALIELMDKYKQKVLAAQYGLPVLSSWLIKIEGTHFVIPEKINYPCFVKPNVSISGVKNKMCRCDDKAALIDVLNNYASEGNSQVLVEEFAHIRNEYSVLGLSSKDGIVAPGVFRVIEGGHRERKGVAISGELVSSEAFIPILNKCKDFIQGIEYTGLFDVDLIETVEGELYFIELNFRAGASMHVLTKENINLPSMMAENIFSNRPIDDILYTKNEQKTFVNEKVLLEEYINNDIDHYKFKTYLKNSDVLFIKEEEDIKPYKYYKKYYIAIRTMRFLYKIKRWIYS